MTSAHFEDLNMTLIWCFVFVVLQRRQLGNRPIRHNQMDNTSRCLLKRQRLYQQEWCFLFCVLRILGRIWLNKIFDNPVNEWLVIDFGLERQRISMFADLAFKLLPSVGEDLADALNIDFLTLHFLRDPMLQAREMNEAHGAITLASTE